MFSLNPFRVGLIVGVFFALWHIVWSIVIAFGWAQTIIDFFMWAHSVNNPFIVGEFNLTRTSILIGFTFFIGFLIGWIFAFIANKICKNQKPQ